MVPYRGIDLLDLESQLTSDERQIRDAVRDWVDREATPVIPDSFYEARLPESLITGMARLGIFGAHIEGYGCSGIGAIGYGLIMQELERADSGLRSFASVQSSLAMTAIHDFGTEQHRQRYLERMSSGELIGAFALTEAEHGSDPSGMETIVEATQDGYRLNGSKYWITNATIADVVVVWAKLDGDARGFIVDTTNPGVDAVEISNKLSMRMSATGGFTFKDVMLPDDALLPGTKGLSSALHCLNSARYSIVWGVNGAAADCLHTAIEYTKQREQFGRPLAGFQMVQEKLADMSAELSRSQLLAYQLGRLKERGKLHWSHVSLAKFSNAQTALDIARTSRDLLGAAGITTEFSPMRHAMNLETVNTYEGTRNMHQLILGRHLTGFNAIG